MAGIGFNASQAWNSEVYVKYGIVNRIPCTISSSYTGTFTNGTVVSLVGNYQVEPGWAASISPNSVLGIAVAQNQVDYTNPANLSVSVMIPTPGAVISVPTSVFQSGSTVNVGWGVYVTSSGQLTTLVANSYNPGPALFPFAMVIASDTEYTDLYFPIAGTVLAQTSN